MLTQIYIEALLIDEELADYVRDLLEAGMIDEEAAELSWALIAAYELFTEKRAFDVSYAPGTSGLGH